MSTIADPVASSPETPTSTPASAPAAAAVETPAVSTVSDGAPVEGADDITITSTTDTEAEVQAAISGETAPAPPVVQAKTPATEAVKTEPDLDAAAASDAGKTLAGRKRSYQERLDELTFQREDARRAAEAQAAESARLRVELDAARNGPPTPGTGKKPDGTPVAAAPAATPKPKLEDFQNDDTITDAYAAWSEALAEWTSDRKVEALEAKFRGELQTRDQRATQSAQEASQHAAAMRDWDAHTARTAAFAATVPNYAQIAQAAMAAIVESEEGGFNIPPPLQTHIVKTDTGPALFFHLVQDPVEFRRIAGLPFGPMLAALGRYEAKLEAQGKLTVPGASISPAGTPTTRTTDARTSSSSVAAPVSSAPAPPTLVGSSPTASTVPLDKLPYDEYVKLRNEQDRRRGRR